MKEPETIILKIPDSYNEENWSEESSESSNESKIKPKKKDSKINVNSIMSRKQALLGKQVVVHDF